jgi:hypothetical protein
MSGQKLNDYLREVQVTLASLHNPTQRAIIEELRAHLEDRAAVLQADGLEKEASMSEAIERFGEAREVGAALRDVHGRGSWGEVLAGVTLFLILGLDLILGEIPHSWAVPTWLIYLRGTLLLVSLVLPAIGFGVGWTKDFPRWSFPYIGLMLLLGLYMESVATPGLRILNYDIFGRELWGWRSWIPFLVVTVIALLITRSLRPLFKLLTDIWEDWTRLTFGMFGFMPLLIGIGFDEVDRLYSLPFMVALTFLMVGTALTYLRSVRQWQRVLALLVGIILIATIVTVAPTVYWLENGWVNVQRTVMMATVVVAVMFSPVLIGLLHRSIQSTRAA